MTKQQVLPCELIEKEQFSPEIASSLLLSSAVERVGMNTSVADTKKNT